ncbi:MAG: DUF1295 domain-containing protein [Myxococcota bacterium]|nr:DUF1295 domain-containing protein [Myxococcota bacterium]
MVPKTGFFLFHLASIVLCAYMVWGPGVETLGGWFGQAWAVTDPARGQVLFAVATLYWLRHALTLFYLLVRKVEWGEVIGLSLFMGAFEVGLCMLAAGAWRDEATAFGPIDGVAIALVLFGSYLNTASEVQRKWWKRHPENKGRCYTEGLFAWSMHINYFGDTVLFTGWCLLTANWWTLLAPLLMAASFVFFHIPGLDAYLEERYGDEFVEYAGKTKKFMPFIY